MSWKDVFMAKANKETKWRDLRILFLESIPGKTQDDKAKALGVGRDVVAKWSSRTLKPKSSLERLLLLAWQEMPKDKRDEAINLVLYKEISI